MYYYHEKKGDTPPVPPFYPERIRPVQTKAMNPLFNLESIYVANIIGIVLIVVMIVCNLWRLQNRDHANRSLILMMFFALTSCIADPIAYTMKGLPGILPKITVYITSTWLFAANMLAVACWNRFLVYYLNGSIKRKNHIALTVIVSIGIAILVLNLFFPLVFSIDENNLYKRSCLYYFFVIVDYLLVVNSLFTYYRSKKRGGVLKFFPIWVYIVPIIIGGVVQSLFYGVSVVPTSIAISIAGVLASLQNEMIYRDSLTGIFNRTYMDYLLSKFAKRSFRQKVTGIMLDLNGFKHINDELGHSVGDEALIATTRILQKSINSMGNVMRYAGDEFIIFINTQDDEAIESCIKKIRQNFDKFNDKMSKPYKLSASMGFCKLDFSKMQIDDFINTIDNRMYEDKKAFYTQNKFYDRRKR